MRLWALVVLHPLAEQSPVNSVEAFFTEHAALLARRAFMLNEVLSEDKLSVRSGWVRAFDADGLPAPTHEGDWTPGHTVTFERESEYESRVLVVEEVRA